MAGYQPLTSDEVHDGAKAYFDERKDKSQSLVEPLHILVGGQPGAGKTQASFLARGELAQQGGFIHVDADRMREQIPLGSTKPTSEQTQADAGRLVAELRSLATLSKRNIIEEGTFRDAEGADKFIKGRQAQGYKVELLAVATPREESLLGIYQRFEHQHQLGSENPRFVPEKYHDDTMRGFENTLARSASIDRVRVIDRAGQVLFDTQAQHNKQANAIEALAAGRKLTDMKLAQITTSWVAVELAARQRNAPIDYLEAVRGHAQRLGDMQKERVYGRALNPLGTDAAQRQPVKSLDARSAVIDDPVQLSLSEKTVLEHSREFLKSKGFSAQSSDAIIQELDAKLRLERPLKNRDGGEPGKLPALRVYDLKADRPTPPSRVKDSPEKPQDQAPAIKSPGRER